MSFRRFFAGVATVVAAAWAASVWAPSPAEAQNKGAAPKAQLPVQTWELPNGLTVAHAQRPGTAVSVQVWYRAGARYEPENRPGLARMFEHLANAGSRRVRPGDHRRFPELAGGFPESLVIEDASSFGATVPEQLLPTVLALEADRMRGLEFPAGSIRAAQQAVADAYRTRSSGGFVQALRQFMQLAYSAHPYRRTAEPPGSGTVSEAEVKAFYDAHYSPDNALLVIVGPTPADTVKAAVKAAFGSIPKSGKSPAASAPEPAQTKARRRQVKGTGPGFVLVGYHIPRADHADIYALQLMSLVLSRGQRSRLARRFASGKLGVTSAAAEAIVRADPGVFVAYASFPPGGKAAAIESALTQTLEGLAKAPVSAADLSRAVRQLEGGILPALDSASGLARQIGQSWVLTGVPGQFLRDLEAFRKVTPASLQAAAKIYLRAANRSVLVVGGTP